MSKRGTRVAVDLIAEQGPAGSGIGRYVYQLANALGDVDVDVEFHQFRYLPGAKRRSLLKALPIGVAEHRKSSVVHIPQIIGASMVLISRVRPVVVTVHDMGIYECHADRQVTPFTSQGLIKLAMEGVSRADHIIAVSDFTRDGLLRLGISPGRVSVVYQGVDLNRFRSMPNAADILGERYGIDFHTLPVVLYVGNELPRKNLMTLVQALGDLKRGGTPLRWVKVGAPGYAAGRKELISEITKEGIADLVTFADQIPDQDLPLFYSAASVYVQPSIYEGFGLPVLEAMACGTPVVASNAGSLPEICGDAALIVDPSDSKGMAGAIGAILQTHESTRALSRAGTARAAEFTWQSTAEKTRNVYERVSM